MAIDERGDQTSVDEALNPTVVGLGFEDSDRLFPIPEALELEAVFVQPAAPIAVTDFFRIVILDSFLIHHAFSFKIQAMLRAPIACWVRGPSPGLVCHL